MANIDQNLESDLKELLNGGKYFSCNFYDKNVNDMPPNKAEVLTIWHDGQMLNFNLPKNKLVNAEYIMNKINKDSVYKNFCNDFKKILIKLGINESLNCYPTSYGLGISVIFSYRGSAKVYKSKIDEVLNDLGIKYTTEFSDAMWVFRYKISKSSENIEKIKNL